MSELAQLILVLVVVAAACAVPGVFLVLRRMSLVSDAIGHVLLLGIVLAYFIVQDADSPWLMVGAALTGLLTVALVEALQRTNLVKADAAIGLVFPALFSLGVLLVSVSHLRSAHLDIDRVLLGQPDLATVPRFELFGIAVPPLWVMGVVLAMNVVLVLVLYKELKLSTFDPALAASLGFRPGLIHYGLMAVVSVTAVVAFDAVGPVLVVGFFVVPAAAAYLLTDRLGVMLLLACGIGALGAALGVIASDRLDSNTAGTVAAALGALFALVFLFAPGRGQLAQLFKRFSQRRAFEETMLAVHLYQHEGTSTENDEARLDGIYTHLSWEPSRVTTVVERATGNGLVMRDGELLKLTEVGRERAKAVFGERGTIES
ncbi:MAG: metal ABC transporter permease [Planctomycetaceae bacterium]|nr:metal ABC transporter permease [Planctomycetaceae bacterium]